MSTQGVYIYADESGHSGKEIFKEQSALYYQGAVLIDREIDSLVEGIIASYCEEHGLERLHGFELGEERTNKLCIQLLDALDQQNWEFHYTIVQKRYLAPTKFVDTIFDCWDNPAVPKTWYVVDLLRHSICLVIDDMMHDGLDEDFWRAYLADDLEELMAVCRTLLVRSQQIPDQRLKQVVSESLAYAIENPQLFTLISAKGKSAYKKQTPNMVAFSSLLNSIHGFCNKLDLGVKQFVHDQNDEFRGTMREFHKLFFKFEQEETSFGGVPTLKDFGYDIGQFMLESSKKSYGLQVVDLFLWLLQRDATTPELQATKARLLDNSVDFVISRHMSVNIVQARYHQVMTSPLSQEQLAKGKEFSRKLEEQRLNDMQKKLRT
ncbi:TPA: DUF3800 domain-containing protein [Vibrio parahaemolyticus]|nr:DUF3800 domain-containing protein [Vibrio parahaemolyticus]